MENRRRVDKSPRTRDGGCLRGSLVRCLALGALLLAGCGGSHGTPPDGGAGDLALVLDGERIATGSLQLFGVTSDDVAAVLDSARGAVALPLAGGDPIVIDPASQLMIVQGNVIFSYHHYDVLSRFGDVTIYSTRGGVQTLGKDATLKQLVADDGNGIFSTQATSSDALTTDLVLAHADGSVPVVLFGQQPTSGPCGYLALKGAGRFVVAHCPLGATTYTVSSIDPATGATVDLATGARLFTLNPATSSVIVIDAAGAASLIPVVGGSPTPIAGKAEYALLSNDGSFVLVLSAGVMTRVPLDGSPTVTLVSEGVLIPRALSGDNAHLVFAKTLGERSGATDLWLTPAIAPAPPIALSMLPDASLFGDAFTTDSSRVLYETETDALFTGTLQSQPVGGGPVVVHGRHVWGHLALDGTRIAFNDDYQPLPKRDGIANLRVVDTASGEPPTLVATRAGARFGWSAARDRIVYTFDDGSDRSGLYVKSLR
jgi:hypothetical protein